MRSIYWIGEETGLAIVARPRGDDWLDDELRLLKDAGIDMLVSMLTPEEETELGLSDEARIASAYAIEFRSYPIADRTTPPDLADFRRFIEELSQRQERGTKIGVHCRGSIGRATIATASLLIHRGWSAGDALRAITLARGCPVPDTQEQRLWIEAYSPEGRR